MGNQIYTYKNIEELRNHPKYNQIKTTLHICADKKIAEGMNKKYREDFSAPILSITSIIQNLVEGWDSQIVKMGQYVEITRKIKEIIQTNPTSSRLLKGFRRNQKDVLASIRLLVEANIYPEDFVALTEEENAFVKIWELVDTESSILRFRNEFHYNYNDNNYFLNKLKIGLTKVLEIGRYNVDIDFNKFLVPKSIICHGFFYITPLQDRFFQLLENSGIEIIFLNCYNSNYPKVFRIWEKTFDKKYGYPTVNEWIGNPKEKDRELWGNVFADIYEEKPIKNIKPTNTLEIIKYDDLMPFINQYLEDDHYYSPDAKGLNTALRQFFPDRYEQRHFLSYPIGQYIFELHRMWSEEIGGLVLDMEGLVQCFSSGWLFDRDTKINAKSYAHDLRALETYFDGCINVNEWMDRFNQLINIMNEVVIKFNTNISKDNKNYKYHNMLSNPFLNFSFFSIDVDRIVIIKEFVDRIIHTAKDLFEENKEVELKEHLTKIRDLLQNNYPEDSIYEEEKVIVEKMCSRLTLDYDYFKSCFPEDIAEGLMILLGGELNDNEDNEDDEEKIVFPITKIVGETLINDNKAVHVCQLNEELLPGNTQQLTWPLTEKNIDRIDTSKRKGTRRLLERTKLIIKEHNPINRYLFYCLLNIDRDIKLSWIKNWDDKELNESIYIQLLQIYNNDLLIDNKQDDFKICPIEITKDLKEKRIFENYEISSLPEESILEYVLCPRKFFYSYIGQDVPTYYSEFHHNFVFTGLLKSMQAATQMDKKLVFKELEGLFPQWNSLQKQQLLEYVGSDINSEYSSYENVNYIDQRKLVHFLNGTSINQSIENPLCLDEMKRNTKMLLFQSKQEKELCKYCAHIDYCRDAIYPLDKEAE